MLFSPVSLLHLYYYVKKRTFDVIIAFHSGELLHYIFHFSTLKWKKNIITFFSSESVQLACSKCSSVFYCSRKCKVWTKIMSSIDIFYIYLVFSSFPNLLLIVYFLFFLLSLVHLQEESSSIHQVECIALQKGPLLAMTRLMVRAIIRHQNEPEYFEYVVGRTRKWADLMDRELYLFASLKVYFWTNESVVPSLNLNFWFIYYYICIFWLKTYSLFTFNLFIIQYSPDYDEIIHDASAMLAFERIFTQLELVFQCDLDVKEVISAYGKILINSFAIQDEFFRPIARAVFLGWESFFSFYMWIISILIQ